MLVFWYQKKFRFPPHDISNLLVDGEQSKPTDFEKWAGEAGVHMLTIFGWKSDMRMLTSWMPNDLVDSMVKDNWSIFLWRTDTWPRLTMSGVLMKDVKIWKEPWTSTLYIQS